MYRNFIQHVPDLIQEVDFVGPIKSSKRVYKETIPEGLARLPARLADPDLMAAGKPTFLRIGEGNEPRNELLRVVKQYPSKDEVRTKVLGEMFPPTDTDPYFTRPDNIAAIRTASEQLGIPLERTGLRIATHPFRLEGNVADVNLLADITKQAAINLQKQGSPVLANALTRKAQFFNQPRSYRELAVDGSEGIDNIIAAYEKAEPRVTANSQGNRPILMQADGLDPNIGIPSGSPKNIPPMDIEGLRGAYAYKPVDELKRPRFIDMGYGVYTRSGEPINAEQKNLLDMGMADLEDRSFILRDPATVNRAPVRALASALPSNYYSQRERNIPTTPEAIPPTRMARDINNTPIYYSELPEDYYGIKRDIPDEDRAKYSTQKVRGNYATGVTVVDDSKPLTDEIGSIIGYKPTAEEYRDSKRLGFEVLGMGQKSKSTLNIPEKISYALEDETINKDLWGTEVEVSTGRQAINKYVEPSRSKEITAVIPARRMSDSMSDRILANPNYLKQFEPFKSNRNTYGAREGKTPWREYYSDPFVYEDKGIDSEVNRLIKAVNEAPAQLENAYTQQANANRRASDIQDTINVVRRMGRGTTTPQSDVFSLGVSPELIVKPTSLFNSLKKDRRMAEVEASKAADRIAELKAAQELMGVEYMVKPKPWGNEVLDDYASAARTKGAMKDSGYLERLPTTDSLGLWRSALDDKAQEARFARQYSEPDRDYDIASAFGFSGNY